MTEIKYTLEMTPEEFAELRNLVREAVRTLDEKVSEHYEHMQQVHREIENVVLMCEARDREETRAFLLRKLEAAVDHNIDTFRVMRAVSANMEQAEAAYVMASLYKPTPLTDDEKVGDHLVTADLSKKDRDLLKLAGIYLLLRINDPVVGLLYCVQDGTMNCYYTPYDLRAAIDRGRQFFKETRKALRGSV